LLLIEFSNHSAHRKTKLLQRFFWPACL
jgi:hypothetical protein